jgi:hypothetical protein
VTARPRWAAQLRLTTRRAVRPPQPVAEVLSSCALETPRAEALRAEGKRLRQEVVDRAHSAAVEEDWQRENVALDAMLIREEGSFPPGTTRAAIEQYEAGTLTAEQVAASVELEAGQ